MLHLNSRVQPQPRPSTIQAIPILEPLFLSLQKGDKIMPPTQCVGIMLNNCVSVKYVLVCRTLDVCRRQNVLVRGSPQDCWFAPCLFSRWQEAISDQFKP